MFHPPNHRPAIVLTLIVLVLLPGVAAVAEPVSDDVIDAKARALLDWRREHRGDEYDADAYRALVNEAYGNLDFEALTATQIARISGELGLVDGATERAAARLETLAGEPDAGGASAAAALVQMRSRLGGAGLEAALRRTLTHPGFGAALADGSLNAFISQISSFDVEVRRAVAADLVAVEHSLTDALSPKTLAGMSSLVMALMDLGDVVTAESRDRVRRRLVTLCAAGADAARPTDEKLARYLDRTVRFLDGAFVRGELLEHPTPELTFTWSSGERPVKSIWDLRGKVVVLDFWATWCGPCIRSIPHTNELMERYKDDDVVIIGVCHPRGVEQMATMVDTKGIAYPVCADATGTIAGGFAVDGFPDYYIIDREGTLRVADCRNDKLDEALAWMVQEQPAKK
ncbi:MAG: TlpA family protein disulfide reductase [Phycisphaerales bacterium]|nr:TlpA family protein disulfide reductase [Phycisphaerales bacterium]